MITALWHLLLSFGQIGLFSLGGGNSMLKLIEEEVVERHGWLAIDEFSALVGSSFLFPGLTAVKVAGLVGLKVAGIPGLLVSIIGITLPGLVLAALFYTALMTQREHPMVKKLLVLMQYGAVALLGAALVSLAKPLAREFSLQAAVLAGALFIGVAIFDFSPFIGIVLFVAAGLLIL